MATSAVYPFDSSEGHPSQQNIEAIVRLEHDALNQRTFGERIADVVTRVAVRPWFFAVHAFVICAWMVLNTWGTLRPDPPPFTGLTTTITIEALFVTLLVLAGQHHMSRISDRRAHLDLQINVLAEQEMTLMLRMLERLSDHFNLPPVEALPEDAELKKTTNLEALVNNIDRMLEQRDKKS
jgi:uncharacterized membrane protein